MTYRDVILKHSLQGHYRDDRAQGPRHQNGELQGDLRTMEAFETGPERLKLYADHAGVTAEQAKAVLEALFANSL